MFDSYENLTFFISLALLVDLKFFIIEFGCILLIIKLNTIYHNLESWESSLLRSCNNPQEQ